jgi:hypothetical protein
MKSLLVCLNLCLGYADPYKWHFCDQCHRVSANIKRVSSKFTESLIVNDSHSDSDPEFGHIPRHMISGTLDTAPLFSYDEITCPKTVASKKSLNALKSNHVLGLISGFDIVGLAGFNLSTDIIPTSLGFIDQGTEFFVLKDCCGDLSLDNKQKALDYLTLVGVKVINGTTDDKSLDLLERPPLTASRLS